MENILKTQTALQSALGFAVDLRVNDEHGFGERWRVFERKRRGPRLRRSERLVLNDRVESSEISASDRAPKFFPLRGFDAAGDDVDEAFCLTFLPPVAENDDERLIDVELSQDVAHVDRRSVFCGLGIYRHTVVRVIRGGRDVPFLRVARWGVAVERSVAHPFFEHESVHLHLLRAYCWQQGQQKSRGEGAGEL